jgi:hypothetical protein
MALGFAPAPPGHAHERVAVDANDASSAPKLLRVQRPFRVSMQNV